MTNGWVLSIAIASLVVGVFTGFFFAIHMNAETADRYVLYLGSVGEWVSGIGALVAVVTAVVLADKQRKDAAEHLILGCDLRIANDGTALYGELDIVVEVVSSGLRPAKIKSVKVWGTPGESGYRIFSPRSSGHSFPVELNYGDTLDIRLESQRCAQIIDFFKVKHGGDLSKARLTVSSTLASWDIDISKQLARWKLKRDEGGTARS